MTERTLDARILYSGRVLDLELLDVELEDGRRATREIARHAAAVGVLARLPDGRFVWVRQYRKAVEEPVIEICAGLVEPGETPEAAARRELMEETGHRARRLEPLARLFTSPGFTDERVDLFRADCDPVPAAARPDADERVERLVLSREEIETGIRDGRIRDAKSVAAWFLGRDLPPGHEPV